MSRFFAIFAGILLVLAVLGYVWFSSVKARFRKAKDQDQQNRQERLENLPAIPLSERDPDAIYQWSFHHGERLVARAFKAEIDESHRKVTFAEITHSDLLLLPDECQYQKYKVEIDTVGDAIKVDKMDPSKGRILRDVTGHITGYVEQ